MRPRSWLPQGQLGSGSAGPRHACLCCALIAHAYRYNDLIIQGQIDYEALDNGVKIGAFDPPGITFGGLFQATMREVAPISRLSAPRQSVTMTTV